MKLNELKVGDKVRYKTDFCGKETIDFGIINSLESVYGYFRIKDIKGIVNLINAKDKGGIYKKNILAKIIALGESYEEILIEKEEDKSTIDFKKELNKRLGLVMVEDLNKEKYFPKVGDIGQAKVICKECCKLRGCCSGIESITYIICGECKNKPAPKSFKFDFYPQSLDYTKYTLFDNRWEKVMDGTAIVNNQECHIRNFPAPEWFNNLDSKAYTIEIKEKE